MGLYCFGAFLKVLSLCSPRSTTNKYLCGTMFLAVNESYDIRTDDGTVGHLINCTNNVSPFVTDNIASADVTKIVDCFENSIIPKLSPDKQKYVAAALIDILLSDEGIDEDVSIGVINPKQKFDYRLENEFVFAELLADLFLFSIDGIANKSGLTFIKDVTKDYIASKDTAASNILFCSRSSDIPVSLPKTLRAKNFHNVFSQVSNGTIGLKNAEELKIFMLKIEDNAFSYSGLCKLLNSNIGRYVFSRLTMERYRQTDDLESVGGEAAQYIREHATGNELGDMLVYAFLEEILNAPKLMSAIELGSADGKCSGIHLHTVPNVNGMYQLVYGASNIEGSLRSAIDNAFDTIGKLKSKRVTGSELVNSASFNRCIDIETARKIKEVVIPSKGGKNPAGTAFGVFLGYTLDGIDPEEYSPSEFITEIKTRMDNDIREQAPYILSKIKSLKMGMHSFYIYILPFNDADSDRVDIISKLIGGAAE